MDEPMAGPAGGRDDTQIGVVVPTYNRERLVVRAVESVLQQRLPAAEVLVVDDGSTDDTARQIARFPPVVKYIYQRNAGASAARNRGVDGIRSPWVAFLDSDDVWYESHLERMAHAIHQTGGAARIYFADALLCDRAGERRLWEVCNFGISGVYELKSDATDWVMTSWPPMLLQSSVLRRSAYVEAGGLWERLPTRHDTHLFLKLGLAGSACAVAGCSARITDDDPGQRLTLAQAPGDRRGYLEQVLMLQDILSRCTGLRPADRRELRQRLAAAHRRLARMAWDERQFFRVAKHAGRSAALAPGRFVAQMGQFRARSVG
jgi:glycosyltransferase involved in cell wall biosynthesis